LEEFILPDWKPKITEAQRLYERRQVDKDTFSTIRRALHPDSRNSISDKKLAEAFRAFMGLEKNLLNEKDSPTKFAYPDGSEIPSNLAECDKRRAAAKKAKRTSGRSAVRPR
jgi:hypothetical protein